MDSSEEIDSSEEKVSSVKIRINSSLRKPKQFSVHSFEQNGDQMESNRSSADVVQKKGKKEKKMMVVYLPVDIPSGRSRSRRTQEGEHFQEDSDASSRLPQKEDQELCSTFEDSESAPHGELSTSKYMSSHSRMRSNPNLTVYMSKKENRPDPEGVFPRRKHSFSSKSQATPTGDCIHKTWSSLTEPTPPIKILSMDSPTNPKRTSMNSLDICLATPLQYSRHRSQPKPPATAPKRISSPIYRKSKHHFFPYTSQSSAEENRETSVTPTEPATPPNPYQSVLSFSFNVSDTDLDLSGNTKVIRMDVTPTRRVKSVHSISPKADEGMLIDVSDTAHKGSTINVKDDFESLDLSNLTPCTTTTLPTPAIENDREAQDTLIRLIDNSNIQHEWDGEELVGSNDDEENMIFYNSDPCRSEKEELTDDALENGETVETPKTVPTGRRRSSRSRSRSSSPDDLLIAQNASDANDANDASDASDASDANGEMGDSEWGISSSKCSRAATREPSPAPLEKPGTPVPSVSFLHSVDPLSFSLSDYFLQSPEDQANAARYRKQRELEEQQRIARRKEWERIRLEPVMEEMESSALEKGETGETGDAGRDGREEEEEEVLRKFEEDFSKRMKKKEEEEDQKRAELRKTAAMVGIGRENDV